MSKEQKITNNIKVPNKDLETLKMHFPHCFDKDGNFQLEKFKNNLTEKEINFSTESYGLDWLGKSYARLLASDPATTLLKADETHNSKPENANSENLLIKGDNLEVLKHLANAYYEQVKMIYIDPPYNTGSDGFVYADDRKFTVKELQNLIGIDEEKAKRILDFTKQKSNSHSAWLTFMYPRLYIAKQLLKDDGVIFVSIDDNEVAQLRILMDEIFGEENFVGQLVWHKKTQPSFLSKEVSTIKEYILFYKKTSEAIYTFGGETNPDKNIELLNISNSLCKRLFKKENIVIENGNFSGVLKKGLYGKAPLQVELLENLEVQDGKVKNDFYLKGRFKWGQEKINESFFEKDIFHIKSTKSLRPTIEKKNKSINIKPIIDILSKKFDGKIATNTDASREIEILFDKKEIFSNPKPSKLLKFLIKSIAYTDKSSVILDYFAGSGTTGDAVMQLNAEDGGNRKYVLVQLPEPIDPKKNKTAYDFVKNELQAEPTIFEIIKERLLRAAKKINTGLDEKIKKLQAEIPTEENKAEIEKLERCKMQNNFKIFETTPIWEDYDFEEEQFDSSQTLFDAGKLTEDDIKALLVTWKTYDGIALTQALESIDLSGYTAYYSNSKLYLMHKGFSTDNLKSLLEKVDTDKKFNPTSIICFGYHFESKNLRELSENVKSYSNKKNIDIDFITRY